MQMNLTQRFRMGRHSFNALAMLNHVPSFYWDLLMLSMATVIVENKLKNTQIVWYSLDNPTYSVELATR